MLFFTAPVEKERKGSCPESPLLLQLLVQDTENGFLLPGARAEGCGMLERGLNGLWAFFQHVGFNMFYFKGRKDDNMQGGTRKQYK